MKGLVTSNGGWSTVENVVSYRLSVSDPNSKLRGWCVWALTHCSGASSCSAIYVGVNEKRFQCWKSVSRSPQLECGEGLPMCSTLTGSIPLKGLVTSNGGGSAVENLCVPGPIRICLIQSLSCGADE